MIFLGSESGSFFSQLVSGPCPDPDPVSDPPWIFSNIRNINFTIVFPSCECVRLHIMTRRKLFRLIFLIRRNLFLNWAFLLKNYQILSVFQCSLTSNSFRIRSCPYPECFFPDRYPDPAKKFGSDRILIYNTVGDCRGPWVKYTRRCGPSSQTNYATWWIMSLTPEKNGPERSGKKCKNCRDSE